MEFGGAVTARHQWAWSIGNILMFPLRPIHTVSKVLEYYWGKDRLQNLDKDHLKYYIGYNQKYKELLVGDGLYEPCYFKDRAPKIIDYKISAYKGGQSAYDYNYRGAFDLFLLAGHQCTQGRLKEIDHAIRNVKDEKQQLIVARGIADNWSPSFTPNGQPFSPVAHVNPGTFIFNENADIVRTGSFYSSGIMTPGDEEQRLCGIFYCYSTVAQCAVQIDEFKITYATKPGHIRENLYGTIWGHQTPKDLFTLGFLLFDLVFCCVQCCCCLSFYRTEINGGEVDEMKILKDEIAKDNTDGNVNVDTGDNGGTRKSRREETRKHKRRDRSRGRDKRKRSASPPKRRGGRSSSRKRNERKGRGTPPRRSRK